MGQAIAPVVAEAAAAAGPPAQQAMQRRRFEGQEPGPRRLTHVDPGGFGMDRLLQPSGRLAGRRSQGHHRRRRSGGGGLLVE